METEPRPRPGRNTGSTAARLERNIPASFLYFLFFNYFSIQTIVYILFIKREFVLTIPGKDVQKLFC